MTDKELKKLKRHELLELLLAQGRELDNVRKELKQTKEQLASRELYQNESGSLAEAAIKISGVFAAAQAAADMYLENVRRTVERGSINENEEPKALVPGFVSNGGKEQQNAHSRRIERLMRDFKVKFNMRQEEEEDED